MKQKGGNEMPETFKQALQDGILEDVMLYPKSDLHNHAGRGGNIKYLSECLGKTIALPPKKFKSLGDMQLWYSNNIRCLTSGVEGQFKRWEASFQQAGADNIKVLALSFSSSEIALAGGMEEFINIQTRFKEAHASSMVLLPELTYDRACDVSCALNEIDYILNYGYFKSIDICCNEFAQPIKKFKPLYRKAKEYGVRLKAHVGEFGTADDVMEAVEELELDEVHHGIAAATSDFIMKWLADHKIQLNICPTSNVMLNVVDNYKDHPIKLLYHAGVPVTINTDDLLIFNQSVSQEYINLYTWGVLNEDELDTIRHTGLNQDPSSRINR